MSSSWLALGRRCINANIVRDMRTRRRCMSVHSSGLVQSEHSTRQKVTIQSLHQQRAAGIPITMLTAYDYPTGLTCSSHSVDITLVGDSLAQVCLGYASTTQLTLDEMIHHARAVSRATTYPFLIADMPFGSYHISTSSAIENAFRLIREGQVEGLKLEGGREIVGVVKRLTEVGIPVMGHVGLLPQRHVSMSGYKVQGKDAEGAREVLRDALALEEAGAFAILLEAIPKELGAYITKRLRIPTIGIGAGPGTSGQVLVIDDILGTWSGHKPKFVRRFADVKAERDKGVKAYAEAVRATESLHAFPDPIKESYTMDPREWRIFEELEGVAGDER